MIIRRLQKLEKGIQRANGGRRSNWSGAEYISCWLARKGIARLETESLMEAFARALGVTVAQLRVYLQHRAAALPAKLASDITS
jgi:hypothetical protein